MAEISLVSHGVPPPRSVDDEAEQLELAVELEHRAEQLELALLAQLVAHRDARVAVDDVGRVRLVAGSEAQRDELEAAPRVVAQDLVEPGQAIERRLAPDEVAVDVRQ